MKKIGLNINIMIIYLLLATVGVVTLLLPSDVLAQDGKDGLILRYIARGYNNELVPGESKTFFVEVVNDSESPTTNIHFTYDAPDDWVVQLNPVSLNSLDAGKVQTVDVIITPPWNTEKGDYSVIIIADSNIGRRVMSLYVRVEKGTVLWTWVAGLLGVAVIIIFIVIFIRFSKD